MYVPSKRGTVKIAFATLISKIQYYYSTLYALRCAISAPLCQQHSALCAESAKDPLLSGQNHTLRNKSAQQMHARLDATILFIIHITELMQALDLQLSGTYKVVLVLRCLVRSAAHLACKERLCSTSTMAHYMRFARCAVLVQFLSGKWRIYVVRLLVIYVQKIIFVVNSCKGNKFQTYLTPYWLLTVFLKNTDII